MTRKHISQTPSSRTGEKFPDFPPRQETEPERRRWRLAQIVDGFNQPGIAPAMPDNLTREEMCDRNQEAPTLDME